MTPQERDIIGGIFDRLRQAEGQPRDPQAEAFIAERIRMQPYAPYIMAQTIYMQEQALANLQGQIEELQRRPAPQQGGFLSSLFGGGQRQAPPPPAYQQQPMGGPPMGQPGGPWQGGPGMAQQPQRQGMGFLGTAAAAAVGVAGGMMAANALQNAFSHGAAGPQAAADFGGNQGWSDSQAQNASWSDNSGGDWGGGSQSASSDWGGGGGDWGGGGGDDI
jgi:hypothetical protein